MLEFPFLITNGLLSATSIQLFYFTF